MYFMSIIFSIKNFDALSTIDLYYILQARSRVFVVEQQCVYQDIDEVDFDSLHLVAHQDKSLIGYCRIIPPQYTHQQDLNAKPMAVIGRVLVLPEHRSKGLAGQIMAEAIQHCRRHYRKHNIFISAQTYLIAFYQSLGFVTQGAPYLEDGLEHINMVLDAQRKTKLKKAQLNKFKPLTALLYVIVAAIIFGLAYLII